MAVEQFVDGGATRRRSCLGGWRRLEFDANCGLLDLLGGSIKGAKESIKVKMPVSSLDKVPDAEVKLCEHWA